MSVRTARTIWESMAHGRFLLSNWPWRGLAYVLSTPVVSALAGVPLTALCLPWLYLVFKFIGPDPIALGEIVLVSLGGLLLVVAGGPLAALPVAQAERVRLRLVQADAASWPHVSAKGDGWIGWLHRRYTEPATWREVVYLVVVSLAALPCAALFLTLLMVGSLIISPFVVRPDAPLALGLGRVSTVSEALPYALLGLGLVPVVLYVFSAVAGLHGATARRLISGASDEHLRLELVEISQSRERLVNAFEAERRRIERDLHDGAQQRLVSLILQLGLAKVEMPPDSPGTDSVANAHDQAKQLLVELREFIHGIHPQALSDLGLPAALRELADRSTTPVTVTTTIPQRPPATVESAAYFVVAESLSNASKHSDATEIQVSAEVKKNRLTVEITDNGQGGADAALGTGLTGLADRAAALGGTLSLSSPIGGPTTVRAEFPCSPK
ncbi:sensor histidine kinase [Lentzea sp. NPDC003310]|uniref:sensor histidine kinase n=1 Tax=Lentzea sp. NPDC003310 TaxID=3154447 RepID=UPI0033A3D6E5